MSESGCQVKAQSRLRSFVAYLEMVSLIRVYGALKHSLCLFVFGHSPPQVACENAIHFLSPLPLKGVLYNSRLNGPCLRRGMATNTPQGHGDE